MVYTWVTIREGLLLFVLSFTVQTVRIRQVLETLLYSFFLLEVCRDALQYTRPITAHYSQLLVNISTFFWILKSDLSCSEKDLPVIAVPPWIMLKQLCVAQWCFLHFFLALFCLKCSLLFLRYIQGVIIHFCNTSKSAHYQCSLQVFILTLVAIALWFQLQFMQVLQCPSSELIFLLFAGLTL